MPLRACLATDVRRALGPTASAADIQAQHAWMDTVLPDGFIALFKSAADRDAALAHVQRRQHLRLGTVEAKVQACSPEEVWTAQHRWLTRLLAQQLQMVASPGAVVAVATSPQPISKDQVLTALAKYPLVAPFGQPLHRLPPGSQGQQEVGGASSESTTHLVLFQSEADAVRAACERHHVGGAGGGTCWLRVRTLAC